jgi:hypothetical protein
MHYWIYGAGATILAGIVAFISFYPQSHFVAFMVLAAFCSLVAAYQLYTIDFSPAEIAISIIPIFGIALVGCHVVGPNLPAETENHGWLLPAELPVPTTNCFPDGRGLMFIAGRNIAKFDSDAVKATLLTLDSTHIISVEQQDNKLSFNVDLFDDDGNIAVKIIRNEFHLTPNSKVSYQERSDDRSAITVHDNKDREILYIKYANPKTVFIRGIFHSSEGNSAVIDDDEITLHGTSTLTLAGNCARDIAFTLNTSGFSVSPFSPPRPGK